LQPLPLPRSLPPPPHNPPRRLTPHLQHGIRIIRRTPLDAEVLVDTAVPRAQVRVVPAVPHLAQRVERLLVRRGSQCRERHSTTGGSTRRSGRCGDGGGGGAAGGGPVVVVEGGDLAEGCAGDCCTRSGGGGGALGGLGGVAEHVGWMVGG
ncbi:hypothetical protein P167DRAFT_599030, partial [Morchella conica CCBAS932]